jgi:hypothetical protein
MNIRTHKGSGIELLKRERDLLTKAVELLDAIAKHAEDDAAEFAAQASDDICKAMGLIDVDPKPLNALSRQTMEAEPCPNK